MTPKKVFIHHDLILIKPFIEFFYLSGNSIYEHLDNGISTEILRYSPSMYSIVQADHLLIQSSNLCKTS